MLFKKKQYIYDPLWNQPEGTDAVIPIEDIIIPPDFAKTTPLKYKMKRCAIWYEKLGHLDKPISVISETNERGRHNKFVLIDEYSRYLYMKYTLKQDMIPIRYISIDTYCNERNI